MSNGVFNFNFLALLLSEILGGPKFTLGVPTPPGRPLSRRNFCTQSEYFTISNCVFNFNILALVVSEILGGLTERALYNRFALKNLPKWGFWGILGGGVKIFGGNPLGMQ